MSSKVLRSFYNIWDTKAREMKIMQQSALVRPVSAQEVIQIDESDESVTKLRCGPAVFMLSEKAGNPPKLFVVVDGSICIETTQSSDVFQTKWFRTKVGYFRKKPNNHLVHVYGVHYDMDQSRYGHPVFHAQMGPAHDLASAIKRRFQLNLTVEEDHVSRILRNVRTPPAQMDFFSVFTQLCADHLISEHTPIQTDDPVRIAFSNVQSACRKIRGAAHELPQLSKPPATDCYRSSHWYSP